MPKIAMIGCGGMGRHHARVLTGKLDCKIAAASDAFDAARERFQADYPETALFKDHRALLEKARPDAVWICLPTFLHTAVAVDCARAGVHVMLEKPMALTAGECSALKMAVRTAGIKLMVAFCRRFDNHWGALRRLLVEDEVIGRPVVWRQMSASGSPGSWYADADKGGGPFLDGCVHNYDFCLWTFGRAVGVKSSLLRLGGGTAFDTGVADVVFADGDRTTLNWSWGLPRGARGASGQDILGSRGALHFGIPDSSRPDGFDPDRQGGFHVVRGQDELEVFTFEKNDMYEAEDRHFLACLASGEDPVPGPAEGLAATELAERVLRDADRASE